MNALRHRVIGAGLRVLRATGLHRIAAPLTRGRGAILTFHRVAEPLEGPFAPNRLLEITPAFLDRLIPHVKAAGYRIVGLDEVIPLLRSPEQGTPFVALTFDDGYRDTLAAALPVLERHHASFTVFATTGFLDRTAPLWWVDLERAVRRLPAIDVVLDGRRRVVRTRSAREKTAAFEAIRRGLLRGSDEALLAATAALCTQAGLSSRSTVDELCMDWGELDSLAAHPLVSIGCHTLTHPRLALLSSGQLRAELAVSRSRLEKRTGRPVDHLCYPYGFRKAAGRREYDAASDLGYRSAVTTRPGVLFRSQARRPTALPRISVNGLWQSLDALDVLLSGAGFAIWNLGRNPSLD